MPHKQPHKEKYAEILEELRKKKGMTLEEDAKLAEDPLTPSAIKAGDADGEVAGAQNTTGKCTALHYKSSRPHLVSRW